MRIGIYNEPAGGRPGGSEYAVAVLAGALARAHDVEILHHRADVGADSLAAFSGVSLDRVAVTYVPRVDEPFGRSSAPWRRYRNARGWQAGLSGGYDLFVNSTHGIPPFCHARYGVLLVLFPFFRPPFAAASPDSGVAGEERSALWQRGRRAYYSWEWKRRLASYQLALANSEFTRDWTRRRWGVDCKVAYPPVDTRFDVREKRNLVLSVGRFTAGGHSKKQLPLMEAFQSLRPTAPAGWRYETLGGLDDAAENRAYCDAVRAAAAGGNAAIRVNVSRADLKRSLAEAKVFWHGTGLGEDPERRPELTEHFGIATVEAMAAGCVPVVIHQGAQPEIVEHGVNGFLWHTLGELQHYTRLLMEDDTRRRRMADAARTRAARFRHQAFIERMGSLLEPMLPRAWSMSGTAAPIAGARREKGAA